MNYSFSKLSRQRMEGVHPDLIAVMELALSRSKVDFLIVEGLRTRARQAELVKSGASQTMNSRHLTGHAIDIAPYVDGAVRWDWPLFHELAPVVKQAAADLGVSIEWGGDWTTFKDGPHWQLPWAEYSADDMRPRHRRAGPFEPLAPVAEEVPPAPWWRGLIDAILNLFRR